MMSNGSSSWNRSHESVKGEAGRAKKAPSAIRGIVAGLVVVAIAAVVYFVFFTGSEKPQKEVAKKQSTKIKEVTPAAAPMNAVPERELTKEEKQLAEIKRLKEKFGDNMPAGLKMHIYYLENPPKTVIKLKNPYEFLQHPSEQEIASIINIVPGTEMIEKPEFGESFNRDFINAMLDKIEINDDDSEEVRQMKSDVAEAKKQIAKICKEEGKKPNQVMSEYATSLFELSKYKLNLEEELIDECEDGPIYGDKVDPNWLWLMTRCFECDEERGARYEI